MNRNRLNRITQFFPIDVLENDQLKGRRMNKNRLNRITQFQLKGSLMNKNRLNRITQFIGMSLLVAGFVLFPVSKTTGADVFGTNGIDGLPGLDGISADGTSGANGGI